VTFRNPDLSRRHFLRGGLALGAAGRLPAHLFAEELLRTPRLTEGPFYPDRLPLDTDNDLIIINDSLTPAVGEVTHLTGRILDASGSPVKDATIEIWQCDAHAVYIHTRDSGPKEKQRDKNFQGFGRFTTDSKGGYRFRTIKPVPYPGRPRTFTSKSRRRIGKS
jgi:protocatechuate 3,4-dioxygenase, beta subunit